MNEKHYTVAEVAERLQVCQRTIYRAIKNGELKANRLGRAIRISETALSDFLKPAAAAPATPFKGKTVVTKLL